MIPGCATSLLFPGQSSGIAPVVQKTYATWNPNDKGSSISLSAGNLNAQGSNTGSVRSTIGKSTGKWYWEILFNGGASRIGVADASADISLTCGSDTHGWGYQYNTGSKINNGSATAFGAAYSATDVLGFKLDADAGTVEILLNNSSQGTITLTGLSAPYYADTSAINVSGLDCTANFGATAFTYSVPGGYNSGLYTT